VTHALVVLPVFSWVLTRDVLAGLWLQYRKTEKKKRYRSEGKEAARREIKKQKTQD
jgi:hypothetical protein